MSKIKEINPSRKFVDVSYLLFLPKNKPLFDSLSVPASYLAGGNGLYGDAGKREAYRVAADICDRNNLRSYIIDLRVPVQVVLGEAGRSGEADLPSLSFINLANALIALRREAIDRLEYLISEAAKKKYPGVRDVDMKQWLRRDPALGNVLFEEFPHLVFLIIEHECRSLTGIHTAFPVVFFKDSESVKNILSSGDPASGRPILSLRYQEGCRIDVDFDA